jgi:hypothetical protein
MADHAKLTGEGKKAEGGGRGGAARGHGIGRGRGHHGAIGEGARPCCYYVLCVRKN